MKQKIKRGLSLLVALTLILTSVSIPTFADDTKDTEIFTENDIRYQILDESRSGENAVEVIPSDDKDKNGQIPDSKYLGGGENPG